MDWAVKFFDEVSVDSSLYALKYAVKFYVHNAKYVWYPA